MTAQQLIHKSLHSTILIEFDASLARELEALSRTSKLSDRVDGAIITYRGKTEQGDIWEVSMYTPDIASAGE